MATPLSVGMLPTGTVTFLFTDIEGSTRLWETQHATMVQALAHHDAIMREAIESNDGHLVKTTGDGALAVFAIATNAIAASIAAQRALKATDRGELRIKSRMAVHSGTAEQRDGEYHGPTLNRAARLMAAGHGGQILLSRATEELVHGHLPADVALRDMGQRRFKDLIQPERVFQLIVPDLPGDFPPLKTLDARPNNLPAQTTQFIGREDAIRAVKARLSNANVRLLTLSGVGGTGKTRLALQTAADMVDEFEHGVFFVSLAALRDPALVLPAIAKAFDVREAAGRPLQVQLQDYLREKQVLLVLDNFEQVIDAATRVSELMTAAPRLKVLVTSREVLRLSGETDYPVPTMSLPDPKRLSSLPRPTQYEAVALFVDRAMAVKPGFTLTDKNAPAVIEICHRLDGLPLAIELAAARVRVLPPQRMMEELNHRLRFLMGGARDLPARQKTLRDAIDWSHNLLTGSEQRLLRRLSVFVGGCSLEAIEAVCNSESDLPVLDTVESLVNKSLVKQSEAHGQPRLAMLETIHEYARERLIAAGEAERLRERHRDHFLALAEEAEPKLKGAEQAEWLQRLEEEQGNLRAGLDWSLVEAGAKGGLRFCGALQKFWWARGHLAEGREWCVRVLAKAGDETQTAERTKVLNAAAVIASHQGDFSAARALHEESLAIRRKLGLGRSVAASLNNLGNVAGEQGDFAYARELYEESLTINRALGNRRGIANSLNNLAIVAREQGDNPNARALAEQSLEIQRELGDRGGIALALKTLASVAFEQGELASARALYGESLAIEGVLGDRRGIAFSLEGLAEVVAVLGDARRAAGIWGAAERLREEIGSPLAPIERSHYDRGVVAARARLGDDAAFNGAWQEGRASTLEQAIAIALAEAAERQPWIASP